MRLTAFYTSTKEIDYATVSQYCFNVEREDIIVPPGFSLTDDEAEQLKKRLPEIRKMGRDVLDFYFVDIEIVDDPSPHHRGTHLVLSVRPHRGDAWGHRELQRFIGWIELMNHQP